MDRSQIGEAFDPDPPILVDKVIAADYCAKSEGPNFEAFLGDIFEDDLDLIGNGANGKSTFVNVINKLLGDYSKVASSQTLMAKGSSLVSDDLVDLVSARLIKVSETEASEALAEAKIKHMTGGDILKGRFLCGSGLEFGIIRKILLATNTMPQINNNDHGIWRRIQAIPFKRTFTVEQQEKDLGSKLNKELAGILNCSISWRLITPRWIVSLSLLIMNVAWRQI